MLLTSTPIRLISLLKIQTRKNGGSLAPSLKVDEINCNTGEVTGSEAFLYVPVKKKTQGAEGSWDFVRIFALSV